MVRVTDGQIKTKFIDAKGDAWEITVTFDENAQIPDGAQLKVREITKEDQDYSSYYQKAMAKAVGFDLDDSPAEEDDVNAIEPMAEEGSAEPVEPMAEEANGDAANSYEEDGESEAPEGADVEALDEGPGISYEATEAHLFSSEAQAAYILHPIL